MITALSNKRYIGHRKGIDEEEDERTSGKILGGKNYRQQLLSMQ